MKKYRNMQTLLKWLHIMYWVILCALVCKMHTNNVQKTRSVHEEQTVNVVLHEPDSVKVHHMPKSDNLPMYTQEDVVLLASILEAECMNVDDDWRKEATVIMNRLELPVKSYFNPDGTLKGVIESHNGRQFNGTWSESYKQRRYSPKAYDASWDVLNNGYRAFDYDKSIVYFTNVWWARKHPKKYDLKFVNSVDWVHEQTSMTSHSFGKEKGE